MMMMAKMVRRNPVPVSLLPTLGGRKMNYRPNRSIGTKTESEQQILCLTVAMGELYNSKDYKYGWYGITPPISSRKSSSSSSCGGSGSNYGNGIARIRFMSTDVKIDPYLFFQTFRQNLPSPFTCVALNSKIHIIGGKQRCQDGPAAASIPDVLDIDTSRRRITVMPGKPMISGKGYPLAVVLDEKVYVFERRGSACCRFFEVFDPNSNQWAALPALSHECLQFPINSYYPILYEKKKKIFLICGGHAACAFDVTTNSWEYGVDLPTKVLHFTWGLFDVGERHVIQGDLLYLFDPNEFYAYDLQRKELLQVHGLEQETRFMWCETETENHAGESSTYLLQLGKKDLCLVTARGPAGGGLHVVCLKFRVVKRDGGLHAVHLARDSYYIQQAFRLDGCISLQRPGLGTSAIPCSFDPGSHSDVCPTSEEAECRAVAWGIKWAIAQGVKHLEVETDLENAAKHLNNREHSLGWKARTILDDVKVDFLKFSSVKISFCFRNANIAAHLIARHANMDDRISVLYTSEPVWLCDQLKLDRLFCNISL